MAKFVLGAIGYLMITFPLAYIWHLTAFVQTYAGLGCFTRQQPIVEFGFGAILAQSILLSLIYPRLCRGMSVVAGMAYFIIVVGGYHWTVHVLAEAAKHNISPLSTWFGLETLYLAVQFFFGGLLFSWIYRTDRQAKSSQGITNAV